MAVERERLIGIKQLIRHIGHLGQSRQVCRRQIRHLAELREQVLELSLEVLLARLHL
jgi:hypothetical protein